jgi:hypothetical protein
VGISTPRVRSDRSGIGVVLDTAALYEAWDPDGDTPAWLLRDIL